MVQFLIILPFLLLSIVIHEFAHGWVAFLCGDPTARRAGRLTLNPLVHVSWMGMVIVPLLLTLTVHMPFGWANPVPVDPRYFRHPRRDMCLVALAGPLSNVLLAFIALVLLNQGALQSLGVVRFILFYIVVLNLALAIFNILPIPPLDGSKVLASFLPSTLQREYLKIEPYGFFILIVLLYFGVIGHWIQGGMAFLLRLFGRSFVSETLNLF